jgi:hypothetical protein
MMSRLLHRVHGLLARPPKLTAIANHAISRMAPPNDADAPSRPSPTQPSPDAVSTSPNTVKSTPQLPPETSEAIWLRRCAIFSFWAVVLLLGLPIWWKTTAIYRADLPLQAMTDWAGGKVRLRSTAPYTCAYPT